MLYEVTIHGFMGYRLGVFNVHTRIPFRFFFFHASLASICNRNGIYILTRILNLGIFQPTIDYFCIYSINLKHMQVQ
jgi:hypothetical protein